MDNIHYKNIIQNNFKAINAIFVTSTLVAVGVLVALLLGYDKIKWNDLEFPLDKVELVFALLAAPNIYYSLQLKKAIEVVLAKKDKKLAEEIYSDVTTS